MSSLRIDSPEALARFLQILTEESVYNAYQQEMELQKAYSGAKALDEADPEGGEEDPLFAPDDTDDTVDTGEENLDSAPPKGGDSETDQLGAALDEPIGNEPNPDASSGMEKQQSQGDAYKMAATPLDLELGKVDVEGIAGTLNLIRAGRSYKDANVASQLRKYVESLSDAERLAMATFLSALRDIAVGKKAGETIEPNEPEVDIKISPTEDNKSQRDQQNQQQTQQQATMQTPVIQLPVAQVPPDLEDTEAPIQVGKGQLVAHRERDMEFRKYIREVIGRT